MANTYTLIASNTLSSDTSSVTFSPIPSTYTDLVLKYSVRSSSSSTTDDLFLTVNGTSANYSQTRLSGDGASASTGRFSASSEFVLGDISAATGTSNTFSSGEFYLPSYTVAQNKPASNFLAQEQNGTTAYLRIIAALWSNTSTVTSITFSLNSGPNFVSGSSFFLYGIKNS